MTTNTTTDRTPYATDIDLFSDEVLLEPWPYYKQLRDLGPVAYLSRYEMWILTRYDQVRDALGDWETFRSGPGVGMNPIINQAWEGAVIASDPPQHAPLRKVFTDSLRPKFIRKLTGDIEHRADELVERLVTRGRFDAVEDFAKELPVAVVMDLIGFPEEGRDKILTWAEGSFNAAGPQNERMMSSLPKLEQLFAYLNQTATPENLIPGSFGRIIYEAADRGEIPRENCLALMAGYATAALDTTINSVGSLMMLLAQNPDQWQILKANPDLVPSAFLEAVRIESPIQFFSRVAGRDVQIGEATIPQGARVAHSYGAANRDERHYADPDRFDVRRNPIDNLGFDYGTHACPGQGLAKMEGHALFSALVRRVDTLELDGEPTRVPNNLTRGLATLPVRVTAS